MSRVIMDDQGFLRDPSNAIRCRKCDKPLDDGTKGYPAETYAGTFTGLCYPCTDNGPFQVDRFFPWSKEPDDFTKYAPGTEIWSHPPHCPSYRRNREEKFHHPSCGRQGCNKGRVWVSQSNAFGGSYTVQCDLCMKICLGTKDKSPWRRPRAPPTVKVDGEPVEVPMRKDGTAPLKGKVQQIVRKALKAGRKVEWDDPPAFLLFTPWPGATA